MTTQFNWRAPMIRISLPYIFDIATKIEPLANLPTDRDAPYQEIFITLMVADNMLSELDSGNLYSPYLRSSRQLLRDLHSSIKKIINVDDFERVVDRYQIWTVTDNYRQFKVAFTSEIGSFNAFFVTQKGGFDTVSLLDFGENIFPIELAAKVPAAISDVREAAKCLAYENATAAGFHLFRVLESVLRAYYTHETGGRSVPKVRNIAVYVNAMKQVNKGDEKTLILLKHISDVYRNPLIHPDSVLTFEEAVSTHGIVRSAVTQMLSSLPVPPQTTATALAHS